MYAYAYIHMKKRLGPPTYRAWFLCSGHGEEEENGEKIFGDVSLLGGCMSEW